ncbi:MAG: putative manganese-dependent inorganic diphosphatase [Verrucomicrobiales bacterium]|nr:putative manganese-dependent inorganic diphosphatase [Verrucomicrobiales bacterium]
MEHANFSETGAGRQPIFVIGHKNPDTDAICSAIGYAELLRRLRYPDAVAACCGGLNPRTRWVLEQAGLEPPRLVMDIRPTAETICRADVVKAREDESFLDVYLRMEKAGIRVLPIVDEQNRITGLASVQGLLHLLMHSLESKAHARRVRTSLANMARTLEGEIDSGKDLGTEEEFILTVSASSVETMTSRIRQYPVSRMILIVADRPEVQEFAIREKVRAMVLTGGAHLSEDLQQKARTQGTAVISCRHDTASAVQLIRCSRRIADAVEKDILSFTAKTLIANILPQIQHSPQALFPVVSEDGGKLIGVFSKSDLLDPPRQRLVLVDHNEFSQAVPGAAEGAILEVVDHHRLSGNLVSREPIRFINEPVGSTSTIVARTFAMHSQTPSKAAATCLAAGIISDTLKLSGPTTTGMDREMLWWLAGVAGIDVDRFAADFFAAGSLLRGAAPEVILNTDRKEFSEHGWHISISQIEELDLQTLPPRLADLQQALHALCQAKELDFACLMVTDILRHDSLLLTAGNPAIVNEIDYPKRGDGVFEMAGVVSRKKQFFPFISRVLLQAKRT